MDLKHFSILMVKMSITTVTSRSFSLFLHIAHTLLFSARILNIKMTALPNFVIKTIEIIILSSHWDMCFGRMDTSLSFNLWALNFGDWWLSDLTCAHSSLKCSLCSALDFNRKTILRVIKHENHERWKSLRSSIVLLYILNAKFSLIFLTSFCGLCLTLIYSHWVLLNLSCSLSRCLPVYISSKSPVLVQKPIEIIYAHIAVKKCLPSTNNLTVDEVPLPQIHWPLNNFLPNAANYWSVQFWS